MTPSSFSVKFLVYVLVCNHMFLAGMKNSATNREKHTQTHMQFHFSIRLSTSDNCGMWTADYDV